MPVQSKYCYPGTEILINVRDIQNQEQLTEFENMVTTQRLGELLIRPVKGRFDLRHLKKIHYYIFQDVYPFAGKLRNENIVKDNTHFARWEFIESNADGIFKQLKEENYLRGITRKSFSERASYYISDLNILHPFREGNGRTQREFIRCLALYSGYTLDWSKTNKDDILKATVQAIYDLKYLTEVINICMV